MRKIPLILILLLNIKINSQQINPLDFFPHHLGDLWQFLNLSQTGSEFWEKKVTNIDTNQIENSITIYFNYRNSFDIMHKIYANDSLKIYWKTFGDWGIRYDLGANPANFWLSDPYFPYYTRYNYESEENIFDSLFLVREYSISNDTLFLLPLWKEKLALGIGQYFSESEGGITILLGCIINGVQYGTIINVDDYESSISPSSYSIKSYPNPFNNSTIIQYSLPEPAQVSIKIYDIIGNEVKELFDGIESYGVYSKMWKPETESSGIYFVVLRTNKSVITHKLLYLK
ncbi:MAG: T9SS type A sorting domain-containing protein [Ignavibacterium sp.]